MPAVTSEAHVGQRPLDRWHGYLLAACGIVAPFFLLFVRLYWGWQFEQTGWGKLHHLQKVTGFFGSIGIPFPAANAIFVSWLEFVGGILLALGLGSRVIALLLAGDMAVAYLTAGRENLLSIFSDSDKFIGDAAFSFLFASLVILFFGPGWISLDSLLSRRRKQL